MRATSGNAVDVEGMRTMRREQGFPRHWQVTTMLSDTIAPDVTVGSSCGVVGYVTLESGWAMFADDHSAQCRYGLSNPNEAKPVREASPARRVFGEAYGSLMTKLLHAAIAIAENARSNYIVGGVVLHALRTAEGYDFHRASLLNRIQDQYEKQEWLCRDLRAVRNSLHPFEPSNHYSHCESSAYLQGCTCASCVPELNGSQQLDDQIAKDIIESLECGHGCQSDLEVVSLNYEMWLNSSESDGTDSSDEIESDSSSDSLSLSDHTSDEQ